MLCFNNCFYSSELLLTAFTITIHYSYIAIGPITVFINMPMANRSFVDFIKKMLRRLRFIIDHVIKRMLINQCTQYWSHLFRILQFVVQVGTNKNSFKSAYTSTRNLYIEMLQPNESLCKLQP